MDNSVFMEYLTNGITKFVRKHQLGCGIMSDEELKAKEVKIRGLVDIFLSEHTEFDQTQKRYFDSDIENVIMHSIMDSI